MDDLLPCEICGEVSDEPKVLVEDVEEGGGSQDVAEGTEVAGSLEPAELGEISTSDGVLEDLEWLERKSSVTLRPWLFLFI